MEEDATVGLSRAFCSARDRNVPVLRRERVDASSLEPTEIVSCLDYGVRCTGWLCPLFSLPTLPPGELLAEAVRAERDRKKKDVAEGRAILERALNEVSVLRSSPLQPP